MHITIGIAFHQLATLLAHPVISSSLHRFLGTIFESLNAIIRTLLLIVNILFEIIFLAEIL